MSIEILDSLRFLSELYATDAPDACLLSEYPSSNSHETEFQNKTEFIIHDPFPPPTRRLLKILGPHHLMCAWGANLPVTCELPPSSLLLDHWNRILGDDGRPQWHPFDQGKEFITLFPHQAIPADSQVVDPKINYRLHSKEVIGKIDCAQAEIFDAVQYPCIAKLSHGYAGIGNFMIRNTADETKMRQQLQQHWPDATLVINSVIENIAGDYGVQFYLRRDGSIVWLGLTQQNFNDSQRWCGGIYNSDQQRDLIEPFEPVVVATAKHLHTEGYFGVVGIDILRNASDECFLIDVNPRLTGITPFLMASRIFDAELGYTRGIYKASFEFDGELQALIEVAESEPDARVMVLSAFEDTSGENTKTVCHISASSDCETRNSEILQRLAAS